MLSIRRTILRLLAASAPLVLACSDPNELAPPNDRNEVDTLSIFALSGTPVQSPSGYAVENGAVRTDRTTAFDFAYDIAVVNNDTTHYFLPQAVLDLQVNNSVNPGLQLRVEEFDEIRDAPSNGYITRDSLVVADTGQVYIVRSRIVCGIGVSLYSKIHVLKFVDSTRTVELEVLANTNCGYKRLTPGFPSQ
jgi:hypothetical protein